MERQNDIVMQLCVACLGAGVITTVAVAQGQNPPDSSWNHCVLSRCRRDGWPGALNGLP